MIPAEVWAQICPVFVSRAPQEAIVAYWGPDNWKELPNVCDTPEKEFALTPEDVADLYDQPPLVLLHSHCNGSAEVSDLDSQMQQGSDMTWGIVAVTMNEYGEVLGVAAPEYFGPDAPRPPLLGRRFLWGVRDCFTLVRDFYAIELGIELRDVPRIRNTSLYPEGHWSKDYFHKASELLDLYEVKRHERLPYDIVSMCVEDALTANHCAVYLGEGKYLQQFNDRTSCVFQTDHEKRYLEKYGTRFYRSRILHADNQTLRRT